MRRPLDILFLVLPWLVLAGYGVLLLVEYRRYLDSNLQYVKPVFPRAPEDVLGFGFWPTWGLVLALVVIFAVVAYRRATKRPAYFVCLAAVFLVLGAVDFYLYQTLSQQVLK
jgi:hypothetical protein